MSTITHSVANGVTLGSGGNTSPLTIASTGTINTGDAYGVYAAPGYRAAYVLNQGSISGYQNGIRLLDGGTVVNSGQIAESGNTPAGSKYIPSYLTGITIESAAGTVVNAVGGTISGGFAGVYLGAGGSISNAGLITGGDYGVFEQGGLATIVNSGTISGGLLADGTVINNQNAVIDRYGVYLATGVSTVLNFGTINGGAEGVYFKRTSGTVIDAGTITAASGPAILFGGSGENRLVLYPTYSVGGGDVSGSQTAGSTNILELGSAASAGTLSGLGVEFQNFGTVTIDAGANWTIANSGSFNGVLSNSGTLTTPNFTSLYFNGSAINTGSIVAPFYVQPNGQLTNQANGIVLGSTGRGAVTADSATVINRGSIVNNAAGTSVYAGVYLQGNSQLTNTATGYIAGSTGVGGIIGTQQTIVNAGTILGNGPVDYGIGLQGSGIVTNTGFIGAPGGNGIGIALKAGGTVIDAGTIAGGGGAVYLGGSGNNALILENGYSLSGGVTGNSGGTNTLALSGADGAVVVGYQNVPLIGFEYIAFAASTNTETLTVAVTNGATLGPVMQAFNTTRDVIDLTQIGTDGLITQNDQTNHLLTVTGSNGSVTLRLDASEPATFTTMSDGAQGTELVACYCRGTLLTTPDGEVAVEDLRIGDRVTTLRGEARPIRWIGRRGYNARFIAGNRSALPICVTAGALAEGVPARNLWLSPEHSLYIDDVLVQAKHLVNGMTVVQPDTGDGVEYFHIEFDTHDIVIADGAAAESFVDCDNRLMFANSAEYAALYPDDERPHWQFSAPRLEWESAELAFLRARLFDRALGLGHAPAIDGDPKLHVIADGAPIAPLSVAGTTYRFDIPGGAGSVWLASRRFVPAETDPLSRDARPLGVAIERLAFADGDASIELLHGCGELAQGFYADEPTHRWTDGRARIPDAVLRFFPNGVTLEVTLAAAAISLLDEPDLPLAA